VQVSLCPNGDRIKQLSICGYNSHHIFTSRKADRTFNKLGLYIRFTYRFYHVSSHDSDYNTLVRDECGNVFETIESWHESLIFFEKKIQLNYCDIKYLKAFASSPELVQEANNLVLSYFYLVSKII
jgi:hypothetical protein